jgi:hypothetical protein
MSGENEVLPENLESRCTVLRLDVRPEVSQRTYGPEPRRTVQSVTGNFIFTQPSYSSCFLILELL